jgi:alanyl-tRNA synthetase
MISNAEKELLKDAKTDKELKSIFREIASENPDQYFPTKQLRKLGFMRKRCKICGTFFWTTHDDREVCGDPSCSGGFQVVVDNPTKIKLSFIGVWEKIVEILEPRGYKPIKRYPCVARWNPTSEFTIASISAFQPYVITGEVEPPAKKLVIPQFCLRFNDIENVGITGSHNTGFVMIGQHSFVPPEEWNQEQLFIDIYDFITIGVGLPKEELTIHEDSWAGGGSFGCSLEFFSRGVELFNQVYTMFEQTSKGPRELKLKVLDMGLGQERVAWFSQGTPNMYEAIFPLVLQKLRERTKIDLDLDLYKKFSKYSAFLNTDEVDDMKAAWERVAEELKMNVKELRKKILPMTGIYSIAEHARTLLFGIHDGKLPSNVGGGYNLRVIFRRAIGFIDRFDWDVDIADVCEWHAEELKELFPEVSENLNEIREILEVEKQKYYATKHKAKKIIKKELDKGKISTETLIEMYDSNGISPDMVKQAAKDYGVKIEIPDNFYNLVVQKHEQSEKELSSEKEIELDLDDLPETESLYYYDYTNTSNEARVLKIIDNYVILNKSVAYPTSGGQLHDIGTISNQKFSNVFKQGNYIIHVLDDKPRFNEGDLVEVKVDFDWRKQLSQHHTATHIVNAAARDILGSHINQAGARKTQETSHLDITHFEQLNENQLSKIEDRANEIVELAIDLNLEFMPRSEAEKKHGMTIYQGGAVPGKMIRIVEISNIDVEACGGTHLNNTKETGEIKILKSQKIQDGVVRLIYTAGKATKHILERNENIIEELTKALNIKREYLFGRIKELLNKWKNINKALASGEYNQSDLKLTSEEKFSGDLLTAISDFLNIKISKIPKKIKKLKSEWEEGIDKLSKITKLLDDDYIKNLLDNSEEYKGFNLVVENFRNLDQEDLKNLNQKIMEKSINSITILLNDTKGGTMVMGMKNKKSTRKIDLHIGDFIRELAKKFGGKGGGNQDYGQAFIPTSEEYKIEDIKIYIHKNL